MPRPVINDDAILFQIALIYLNKPKAKFAAVEREAFASVSAESHSDASRTKRLKRKYDRHRARLLHEASAYRERCLAEAEAKRQREQFEAMADMARAGIKKFAEVRSWLGPAFAEAIIRLGQPEVQEHVTNIRHAFEDMHRSQAIQIGRRK
ncbi:hypothetical protein [Aureimonas psammosilenae]|uniref:hypothetical protein n=1 Tax=Aureimonas psammosilenae TaxID=2495496 RepID=UPI0012608AB3|nr:hypothetical protein [Aureimonas psammosilenae]